MVLTNIIFLFFYIYFVFPNVCVSSWCVTSHLENSISVRIMNILRVVNWVVKGFAAIVQTNALEEWIFPSDIKFCYHCCQFFSLQRMFTNSTYSRNLFSCCTTLRISMKLHSSTYIVFGLVETRESFMQQEAILCDTETLNYTYYNINIAGPFNSPFFFILPLLLFQVVVSSQLSSVCLSLSLYYENFLNK